ncbi:DUF58 domain-containing protein [Cellulomonas marina]|uniref:DUF58 domain-containing protein n=1 Tax=Cellulomonas marina TaxID=988821 RepID=A0A1I0YSQ6_9CELL|nr:DUF58 domain-containing protein [Cellulomonas marina]GIG27527.1 hypothetical protein Cma02nite_01270 [Cellulomonas marina]SFB16334.1 Protein of unknown function DUF58 [Cellulomonas marina]
MTSTAPTVRVTPAGALALVVVPAAAVVHRVLGWAEAGALAAGLGLVLAVAALGVLGRAPYAVTLSLGDARAVVGGRAVGAVRVRNRSRRRTLPHRLRLAAGSGPGAELAVPALPPGEGWEELLVVPAPRRGRVVVGPVAAERGETLGLVRRTVRYAPAVEVLVHPRTLDLPAGRAGLLRDLEGVADRASADLSQSFHALREYVAGDDRRAIHWRSSARLGTLLVRQDEDVRRTRVLLLLAEDPALWADADEVETGVSVLASLALQAMAEGREVAVLAGDERLPTTTRTALLDACARFEAPVPPAGDRRDVAPPTAGGADDPADAGPLDAVARRARRHGGGAALVVVVTGSTAAPHALVRAAHAAPAGARAVVLTCGDGQRPDGQRPDEQRADEQRPDEQRADEQRPDDERPAAPTHAVGHRAVLRVAALADLPAATRAGAA